MSPYTPLLVVSFAFGVGPLDDPSADWVTPDDAGVTIESVNVDRGRDSEFDDFPPSKCQIVIKDANRIFDPSNASGPYSGDLKPRVWVRVQGFISPTSYDRFTGYVDGWPVKNGRGLTTVTVTATDAQKILASKRLPSWYAKVVLADDPVAYWRLGSTSDAIVDLSGNNHTASYVGTPTRAGDPIVPYTANGSVRLHRPGLRSGVWDGGAGAIPPALAVELWAKSDDPVDGDGYIYTLISYRGSISVFANFGAFVTNAFSIPGVPADVPMMIYSDPTTSRAYAVDILDGLPHHIVLNVAGGGNPTLYVDNIEVPVFYSAPSFGTPPVTPNGILLGTNAEYAANWPGRLSDWAIYDDVLTTTQIGNHYAAGTTPWAGDSTGERIERVLDEIGWPAGMRAIDQGEFIAATGAPEGRSVLDYLKKIAESEQGRLFVDASGKITFHQRDRFLTEATETTSQFTFSDDGAGDSIYEGLDFTFDEQKIVNGADASNEAGATQSAVDAASQSEYGPIETSLSGLLLRDDRNARQIAEYLVFRYAQPQERAEGWSLQPELDASSWADVFGLEIGHRVTLECTPANVGSQKVMEQHLERIADTITPESWTVAFNGSPVDPFADGYLILDGVGATQGLDVGVLR